MKYSDTTNKSGIVQMIEQTTNLGDGTITGNTVKFAYFNALINDFYRIAAYMAWKVDKTWVFDDLNHTSFPQSVTTIVDGQRDYMLPTTALKIRQVEVMDKSGLFYTLEYIPEENALLKRYKEQEPKGVPLAYRLVANSLILYPEPDASQLTPTNGLRITTDREVDPFTVSDTTQEPGINAAMQPILYYGPSFVWASVQGINSVAQISERMLGKFPGLIDMLSDFYSNRNEDKPKILKRLRKSYK